MICHIDMETRSTIDLKKVGVHVYSQHSDTEVLCLAYAIDDGPVKLWRPGDPSPEFLLDLNDITFYAHNAAFERAIWSGVLHKKHGWPIPNLEQWHCTMAMALALALPASLQNAARVVGVANKDLGGHALMLQMCKPRRARKDESNNVVHWFEDQDRLDRLYAYCKQDVYVERLLSQRLLDLRSSEQTLWELDQKINDRGIYVDLELCDRSLRLVNAATRHLNAEVFILTDGEVSSINSLTSLHAWLREHGHEMATLDKNAIEDKLIEDLPPKVRRVLEIRHEAAKAAVKKIETLIHGTNGDGRARGLLQFHSASTGRWAGRRFQPQNIKRPEMSRNDVASAIMSIKRHESLDVMRLLYGEPLAVVSDCLRGMICAAPGNVLYAADYSSIESRIQAWLAGENWKLKAFHDYDSGQGHEQYKVTYARAFHVSPDDVTKNQRQIGKVMDLALGYQGGVGAFHKMAAVYGIKVSNERAEELKRAWRVSHRNIALFWNELENCAWLAIEDTGKAHNCGPYISFKCVGSFLFMRLPSGRCIAYPYPCFKEKEMPWGDVRKQICYQGYDTYTRQWGDCFAHGGLLFNNAVQGIARDIEAEAMLRIESAGYPVVLTVHDEIVSETPEDFGNIKQFEDLMALKPSWAEDLPLSVRGFKAKRYRKE